jgi:hypothetical protein
LRASDGKLWIGTFNGGLYCIEGTAIRSFKAGDGSKLLSDKIWALQEDRKGNIWIGFLDAGIQCLNPSDHSFQTIDLEKAGLNDNHIVFYKLFLEYCSMIFPYLFYYFNDLKVKEEDKKVKKVKNIFITQTEKICNDFKICLERVI